MIDEKELRALKDIELKLEKENHLIGERLKKLNELKNKGINPYPYNFDKKNSIQELKDKYNELLPEQETQDVAITAGRILALRKMGKVTFLQIQDDKNKLQIYVGANEFANYDELKLYDMGDYIGVRGTIFKTRTGEITIKAQTIELLSKSLRPLPEKFHGIHDTEIKYRQRYLDLIMDQGAKNRFVLRTKIIKAVKEFLDEKGFLEVETPVLQPIYGGAAAKPFTTVHNELKMKMYLRISLELYLKRLIAGGYEKVYEYGKVFRNESIDTTHNPEFALLELYWAYADYNDIMELVEDCYNYVALKVLGKTTITYQGKEINLQKPWKRMTLKQALKEYGEIDADDLSPHDIKNLLKKHNIDFRDDMSKGLLINQLFKVVEEKLIQPIFIIDHPKETTPLCKLHRSNPELIERFEPYINGWEMGNAYSELNDPIRQRYLLEEQAKELRQGIDAEANPMDEDFCKAVDFGMPPMGGLGLGMERMIMLLTDSPSIRDVIFFPTMKIMDEEIKEEKKE